MVPRERGLHHLVNGVWQVRMVANGIVEVAQETECITSPCVEKPESTWRHWESVLMSECHGMLLEAEGGQSECRRL